MSISQKKDDIANYLFQYFIEGNEYPRPAALPPLTGHLQYTIPLFRNNINLLRQTFNERHPSNREEFLKQGVMVITSVLETDHGLFDRDSWSRLLQALEGVFKGELYTLRPFLDILIERNFYRDPDLANLAGKSLNEADSERAWQQEYQGKAHETLLQNIQSSFRGGTAYCNSGAIIQSSGYGKSRTVDQMATLIPTIPMNIRAVEEGVQGAFPPADATLIDMFDVILKSEKPVQSLLLLFKLLFDLVRGLAKDFGGGTFTKSLYLYLKDRDRRAKLYADLLDKMGQNSTENLQTEIIASEAVRSFAELAKLFPESKGNLKMVIYIDEAHTLASKTSAGASMYDHMLKATAELAAIGVFFLFLSTASRLEVLASQPALSNSARFRAAQSSLVAPFTEMPFDCHSSLLHEPIQSGLKLAEIQKFSFAVRFGRPLFWAYFEAMAARVNHEDIAHIATLEMAETKLICQSLVSVLEAPGKLAILDTLLNLEYDPRRTYSDQLASTMVASHLRTVYSVPASRAYMHTGYPSEPVLAEAALNYIDGMPKTTVGPLLSLFTSLDAQTAGAIHKGERGENVGKMILLLAYTAAVNKHHNPSGKQFWGHGCSLVHFLEELTGDKFITTVLTSVPDNLHGGAKLQEAFKDSWVRFTHFARAADDAAMTTSMAWVAFIRGMAMIGWHSQKVVDLCIPVLIDKNKPIEEANITTILIQLKVREQATPRKHVSVQEKKIKCFPPRGSSRDAFAKPGASENEKHAYHSRPYISLVMELGLVSAFDSASIPSQVVDFLDQHGSYDPAPKSRGKHKPNFSVSNVHIAPPPAPRDRRILSAPVHPRYSLFYYGCSHKVYRCVSNTTAAHEACKTLLQIPTVFNDRPSDRPIDPVLQMKPFWNAGSNCFSWINEPYLKPTNRQNELGDDEVLIGTVDMEVDTDTHGASDDAMDEDP